MGKFEENFNNIKGELEVYDKSREEVIQKSRSVIKHSKLVIYALHREDFTSADSNMDELYTSLKVLDELTKSNVFLSKEGSYKVAVQEFVEAKLFYDFIKGKDISTHLDLNVSPENYLLGLCDLTGELGRFSVIKATKRDTETVEKIKFTMELIFGKFLELNLRNSELRKKSDAIKWNLKKVEEVLYDLSKQN